jgi:hypothetical protein
MEVMTSRDDLPAPLRQPDRFYIGANGSSRRRMRRSTSSIPRPNYRTSGWRSRCRIAPMSCGEARSRWKVPAADVARDAHLIEAHYLDHSAADGITD